MSRRMSIIVVALVLGACADSTPQQVVVSAASSLTDAFAAIEQSFEATHPGVDVVINFGGSSALREQILGGARVDVYAPADMGDMEQVVAAGRVRGIPEVIARNHLQIAVPAGNPAGVTGLGDFSRPELYIGLCDRAVPCGALARRLLATAGIEPSVDSNEPNVRFLLAKIEEGELDAGLVYVTDVIAADGRAEGIDVAPRLVTDYPIAILTDAPAPELAKAFVGFVLSEQGRTILEQFGFDLP